MVRRQIRGVEAIVEAIDSQADLSLILMLEAAASPAALRLAARARALGIPIVMESERELRRMSAGEIAEEVIALEGPPLARTLDGVMRIEGIVFVLSQLRYPGNVGFILRSIEVAGGAGVVLDSDWGEAQREEAFRKGMRANRFLPVIEETTGAAVAASRRVRRRVVAIETSGKRTPWEADLSGPITVLVGSETMGIADEWLDAADEVVAIPVAGFIPSYNVQAAVGIVLGEWMRQNAGEPALTPSGR